MATRDELLKKYSSKKTETRTITKITMPKLNTIKEEKISITNDKFNEIVNKIKDQNLFKIANLIYKGVPLDIRTYDEKMKDPFVMFLIEEIKQTHNKDTYFKEKQNDIENILLIKMTKEKLDKDSVDIKITIFRILLQRIKSEIVGENPDQKDITKKDIESDVSKAII